MIKIEKFKLAYGQGYWYSMEWYVDGILRIGIGRADKKEFTRLVNEFKKEKGIV